MSVLPKLDVAGSSPVARSFEVVVFDKFQSADGLIAATRGS
jgi:hypothetical protein